MVPGLTEVCARACLEYSNKATILVEHFNTLNNVSLFRCNNRFGTRRAVIDWYQELLIYSGLVKERKEYLNKY